MVAHITVDICPVESPLDDFLSHSEWLLPMSPDVLSPGGRPENRGWTSQVLTRCGTHFLSSTLPKRAFFFFSPYSTI